MTDLAQRAQRILELQAKATPGEWEVYTSCSFRRIGMKGEHREVIYAERYSDGVCGLGGKHDDIALAAASHEAADLIRELLAENERLRNALAERTAHWRDACEAKDAEIKRLTAAILKAHAEATDEFAAVDAGPTPLRGRVTRRD